MPLALRAHKSGQQTRMGGDLLPRCRSTPRLLPRWRSTPRLLPRVRLYALCALERPAAPQARLLPPGQTHFSQCRNR
eukprot:SAG31_NODE_3206_length_4554_cov_4.595960_2_plen_77_part_00